MKNPKILLVDDSEIDSALFNGLIKKIPCDLFCVQTLDEALEFKELFNLIIIDLNLTGMSGYEVYSKLRPIHDCNIIIATGAIRKVSMALENSDKIMTKQDLIEEIKVTGLKKWTKKPKKKTAKSFPAHQNH